ncbi:histidine kinase like protein [Zymoseptoria brevis]|uniref:histidine kinase n=1 Tax=Zymoseptoria brevis TaxID=1047168 RepID=A0A0F4GC09_9PEZI|nr:histidine kinase like protein [Zymoseptoria brevis]
MAPEGGPRNAFYDHGSRSWTDVLPRTGHVDLFRNADYGATDLGNIEDFGPALRMYTTMIFTDSRGAGLYWGKGRIAIYNEGFAVMVDKLHPYLMGRAFEDAFGPQMWDSMRHVFNHAESSGQTVDVDNILLFPVRRGIPEESYFVGQFIPLRGDSGEIEGFYNTVNETTHTLLQDRRRRVLEDITALPSRSVEETLALTIEALKENPNDVPMALLYSCVDPHSETNLDLRLRGSIGIPDDHRCAPKIAKLDSDQGGLIPYFRQVRESGKSVVLSETDGSLQQMNGLFEGVSWCGFEEPSRDVVIVPLISSGSLIGFYVQGHNPRRLFDDNSELAITSTARQIEAKWMSTLTAEQATKREAALERRATESENRFRQTALHAPLGMVQVTMDEQIKFANEQFYEITGYDRTRSDVAHYWDCIHPDEVERTQRVLLEIYTTGERYTHELRLRRTWKPSGEDAEEQPAWILSTNIPVFENAEFKLIMSYVLEISELKWAESVQSRNAAAALQAKKQQEEFIDVTSHEMRYSGEVAMNSTSIEPIRDPSIDDLNVDYVLLDTSRLAQVLINLLSNAIKFTAQRPVRKITVGYGASHWPPRVTTSLGDIDWAKSNGPPHSTALPPLAKGEEQLYIWFCVQDTGAGMTAEEMKRLFKRFSQASSRTHIDYGGCGIGLYICRQLAEKQGGQVGVASRKGEGSAFGFYIETRRAEATDGVLTPSIARLSMDHGDLGLPVPSDVSEMAVFSEVVDEGVSSKTVPASPISAKNDHTPAPQHVLLCEDNIVNQRILAKQLRSKGCTVTVANHGQEALEVLEKSDWRCDKPAAETSSIDVVLLDWEMPIMNGLQCCQKIREIETSGEASRRLPVIAITANVRQAQIEEAMAAGMDTVVPKPFTVTELLDSIENLANRRASTDRAI